MPSVSSTNQNQPLPQVADNTPPTPVPQTGNSGSVTPIPPASGGAAAGTPGTGAPTLPLPTGLPQDIDIEALIKLISEESRKEMTSGIIDTIKSNGQKKLNALKEQ
ncbi:MAG: hypothetical protein LBU43_12265, partial [Candidatus Accumulibacter sp.]|nr:hypothetical protein [Accumulibacter sp.]